MAEIKTKYSIGDTVYHAHLTTVRKQHPCPDCKGESKWKATSPAGGEYTFPCPRCSARYFSERDAGLDYSEFAAAAERLTVGSVRVDTHDEKQNSYMCRETGVGSGSIYYEGDLFLTKDEALAAADLKAKDANSKTNWVIEQYSQSLAVCDYQLTEAVERAKEEKARKRIREIEWFIKDVSNAEDMDEVKQLVEKLEAA